MFKWSVFILRVPVAGQIVLKSTLTGAVIKMNKGQLYEIEKWMEDPRVASAPCYIDDLLGQNEFIVPFERDEFIDWKTSFMNAREDARIFTLHFLPTLKCQFCCRYCFENGAERLSAMTNSTLDQSVVWLKRYFEIHNAVQILRVVLFGGEPLLEPQIIKRALSEFEVLSTVQKKQFAVRVTTNGELLNEDMCKILRGHHWEKLQVTLDGPKSVHDARRFGKNHCQTFNTIISNLEYVAAGDKPDVIDIRVTIDGENAETLPLLLEYLAHIDWREKIRLSIGFTTPFIGGTLVKANQNYIAESALDFWGKAKSYGFRIPDEYIVGPWCVAIAKHSAVLQPNGALQKCFCTAGRDEYSFDVVSSSQNPSTRDSRFEQFERTDMCVKEQCPYLPICGGGCIHDALVAYGQNGFRKRFCQKQQLKTINKGLIHINYE